MMGGITNWIKNNGMLMGFTSMFISLHLVWYKLQDVDGLVREDERKLPPHIAFIVSLKDYFKKPELPEVTEQPKK